MFKICPFEQHAKCKTMNCFNGGQQNVNKHFSNMTRYVADVSKCKVSNIGNNFYISKIFSPFTFNTPHVLHSSVLTHTVFDILKAK